MPYHLHIIGIIEDQVSNIAVPQLTLFGLDIVPLMLVTCILAVKYDLNHCTVISSAPNQLNLLRHDLRVRVGSLSRFKLTLPQWNIPGVLNCMSVLLSRFPSLY